MSIVRMRKKMQSWFRPVMLLVAVALAVSIVLMMAGLGGPPKQQGDAVSEGVYAKINGQKLEAKTFESLFESRLEQYQQERAVSAFEAAQIRGQLFDEIVDQMLLVQAAKKERVKVSRGDVNKKINEIIDGQIKQLKEQFMAGRKGKKTDEAFEAELKKNKLSIAKIKSDIRKNIKTDMLSQQLLIEKLNKKLENSVDASDEAVRASYDELNLSQITVSTQKRSEAQAKKRADEVYGKLKKGADFTSTAKQYSEDPFKASGGERGYAVRRAYLEKELADVAFKLKTGEVSEPVKTSQGFVILKLDSKKNALPADYKDSKKKKQYRESYLAFERNRVQQEFFSNMQKNAKTTIYSAEFKAYRTLKDIGTMFSASQAARKAKVEEAIKQLELAAQQANGAPDAMARAYAQIGYLYELMRKPGLFAPTKEEQIKYRDEEENALKLAWENSESNDIDLMLSGIYIEKGQYDKAMELLEIVSQNAGEDYAVHSQLMSTLQKVRGSQKAVQMAAAERKWMADYDKQIKQMQSGQTSGAFQVR